MRILLLGKDGQVGWELQRVLAPLRQIIALGRAELDFSHTNEIRDQVRSVAPDLIINAAAYTAVDRAESEEVEAFVVNALAVATLAEVAAVRRVPLIHYSTDYVFDGTKSGPYVETDEPQPLGAYARSKLAGERAIEESGCQHLIFRTSWVYGTRGKNFMLTMLELARMRPELRVVNDQIGTPNWCRVIAEVTGSIVASQPDFARVSGIYHLTSRGPTSWHGFAERIIAIGSDLGLCPRVPVVPIPTSEYPTATTRPANSALDPSKLMATFGVTLPEWDASLRDCLSYRRHTVQASSQQCVES